MPLVIDASIIGAWHFDDERTAFADALLARLTGDAAVVPVLWWFQTRNLLLQGERRGRSSPEKVGSFLDLLATFDIEYEPIPNDRAVMAFARQYRLTVYDATYLELAQRRGIEIATLDNHLARAARAAGVTVVD